ncbi:MAG TPA: DUF2298 domain-containing protein [Anaerolineales bacterium]|nr:DUF2298 domain-containing protein [Anaerolineales bacterium]
MSDVLSFLSWWLIVTAFGLVAWPTVFRLFRFLPDCGYSLSKTAGLLAVGYVGWLLGNFRFVQVNAGGVMASLLVVGVISLVALRGSTANEMREWWKANRVVVVAVEIVFLIGFGFWAYARSLNPNITFTEKPMEFAFLNSVLRTGTQPPGDPWLSGYAISYYHFGYVIMGMLTALSGVMPSVAFNLGVALLFGLTALGAFGVVLNLVATANGSQHRRSLVVALWPALLGPLFILLGNLNGFFEVAHQRGWFGEGFWTWLDIKWTNEAPQAGDTWVPDRFLWWWQSSRVIHDRNLFGDEVEVIDEFPFFSFLLGDMHPHVLGLPFVFLGIAFALNLFLMVEANEDKKPGDSQASGLWGRLHRWLPLSWPELLGGAVILGGLSFLNTWDFPIYVFVAVAAYAVARAHRDGWVNAVWRDALILGGSLVVLGALLYLPFYIGFRSQLGGILPNVIFGTRVQQFVVMFGPSLFVVLSWLGWMAVNRRREANWPRAGLSSALAILAGLILVGSALSLVILTSGRPEVQAAIDALIGQVSLQDAPGMILRRRLEIERVLTPLLVTGILAVAVSTVYAARSRSGGGGHEDDGRRTTDDGSRFAVVLVITGALLTIGPEFVYLRDLFSTRMNTIFKFYYQAWVLWSLASAFGVWMLFRMAKPVGQALFGVGLVVVLGMGLIYPTMATTTITENWKGTTRDAEGKPYATLDGMAYMAYSRSADYEAIKFLNANVNGRPVIAEAVGGSYTEFARVSAHTGLPTVLGWPFHEFQWRGTPEVFDGREEDVRKLYTTHDWDEALPILQKYHIRYVYVGPMEINQYGEIQLTKFERNMSVIYQADGVTIYEMTGGQ